MTTDSSRMMATSLVSIILYETLIIFYLILDVASETATKKKSFNHLQKTFQFYKCFNALCPLHSDQSFDT